MKSQKLLLVLLAFIFFSCSRESETEEYSTLINGQITVNSDLDSTGDYSGIKLTTSVRTSSSESDTLFHAVTNEEGRFSGIATFPEKEMYPVLIRRNNNTFGIVNVVFAEDDTVHIQGELPNINETVEISSSENDIIKVFDRVDRSFSRVARYINAGAFSQDTVVSEINKWSDIYWEVYEKYPDTYAAKLAGESSVSILRGVNDSLMVTRSREILQTHDELRPVTRSILLEYYAENEGLERALTFIDHLKNRTEEQDDLIDLEMEKIELLYDSSKTADAKRILDQFKETYADHESAIQWAEDISYDLEFLAPGSPFPDFGLRFANGDSLSTGNLPENPYLIEITRLDNSLYQQQFDRTVAIHQIYKNFGLEIITLALATSDVTLEAFFEERPRLWRVAQPNSVNAEQLIEQLNLNRLPTRFLINSEGNIIGRYVGEEYDEIVRGLQQITTPTEN